MSELSRGQQSLVICPTSFTWIWTALDALWPNANCLALEIHYLDLRII